MFEPKTDAEVIQIAREYCAVYARRYGRSLWRVKVPVPTMAKEEIAEVEFLPRGAPIVRRDVGGAFLRL